MTTPPAGQALSPVRIAPARAAMPQRPERALLLDRDGVVNVDFGYVSRESDVVFVPGLFPLCRTARALGLRIVIVTNQSGIARGYFGVEDFLRLSRWMMEAFAERDAPLTAIYACPHRDEDGCRCRKPKPGLFEAAASDLSLDLARSVAVGDRPRDVEAASAAKVGRTFLLGSASCPDLATLEKTLAST